MQDAIEEVKKKIDIVDFLSSYITLKKAGRNFKAVCPFHQEKTPSFVVSPERQIWRCFGSCGEGGDAIKFLMKWENITFFEALKELAVQVGVPLAKINFEDPAWQQKERLIKINVLASEYFHYLLFKTHLGKKGLEYLVDRQTDLRIAEKFQLGYAPSSWDSLLKFLKKKGFDEKELFEGGLVVKSDRGGFYDRFRGRLIFPIKDSRGNVIGFSGRSLDPKDKASKYINTPETPLYRKRESLYGIDLAKEAIKKEKTAILVEGEFDVISPYSFGIENIVATKGTAVTREQLTLIRRFTDHVVLALDADNAGEEAVRKALDAGQNLDLQIEVVAFEDAKDPDEAVKKDLIKFKKQLKQKVPIYDFIIEMAQKKYPDNDPFNKKKVGDAVLPLVERIDNPIIQSHYIRKLAAYLDVNEESIQYMIRKLHGAKRKQIIRAPQTGQLRDTQDRETGLQKYLLSVILQSKDPHETADLILKILSPEDFSHPAYGKIAQALLKEKTLTTASTRDLLTNAPKELQPVIDEVYLFASLELGFADENLQKLAYEAKKFSLKRQISSYLSQPQEASNISQEGLKELGKNLKEVEKKINSL